jgi:hypothetical protein
MTPDEAKALVQQYGSQVAAADAIGVPRSTFQFWMHPERTLQLKRERRAKNPEKERARAREWKRKNAPKRREWERRYRAENERAGEKHRQDSRERYWAMSGIEYNRRLLRQRRQSALKRMAKRNAER